MKYLLFVVLFLITTYATSQKEITIQTNIDEFTNDTAIVTSRFMFGYVNGNTLEFGISNYEGLNYIVFDMKTEEMISIRTDDNMIIKLLDGSLITLRPLSSEISDFVTSGNYRAVVVGLTSEIDLEKLASNQIEKVRIEHSDGDIDFGPLGKKYPESARLAFRKYYDLIVNK